MCLWGRGSPPAHHCPSSFSSPPLLTATEPCSPPASPALACRTTSSTHWDPALAKGVGYVSLAARWWCWWWWWWWWSWPTLIRFLFVPTQQKRRKGEGEEEEGKKKTLSSAPANASALSPALSLLSLSLSLSPLPKRFMGSSWSLSASQSVRSEGGRGEDAQRWKMGMSPDN